MGSTSSKAQAHPAPPADAQSTLDRFDAAVAATALQTSQGAEAGKSSKQRHSTASVPMTTREHLRVQTKQPAPLLLDPRSPTAPRTPLKVIRQIRASMVAQEQLAKQLAELAGEEEKDYRRRNTTQLTSIPSVRALLDRSRLQQSDSPKVASRRIEVLDENPSAAATAAGGGPDGGVGAAAEGQEPQYESTKRSPHAVAPLSSLKSSSSKVLVVQPFKSSRPAACLSPLSEFVDTDLKRAYYGEVKQFSYQPLAGTPAEAPACVDSDCKEEK